MRVVIRSHEDEGYRHVVAEHATERHADRVVSGIEINLNHETYYVTIEED